MRRPAKSLVLALSLAMALTSVLATVPTATAAQNGPRWTQGDFWVYSRTAGGETTTVRAEVLARESITLPSGTRSTWHVRTTNTDAGGNATSVDSWYVEGSLSVVKTNFTVQILGDVQVTFDPPLQEAVFPLEANAQWSLSTTVGVVGIALNFTIAYSGRVLVEGDSTVPAGTFRAAVIRTPSTASDTDAREEAHYSEGAGNYVKRETYDGNGNRVANQELTSYRYQSGSLLLIFLVVGGLVAFAVLVGALVAIRRRRRARMPPPPGAYPPRPPQPPEEPPMSPPGGPPGP